MEHTLVNHPKLSVREKTGIEGPSYDPYGYYEVTVKTPEGVFVLHEGLAVYALIGDQKIEPRNSSEYNDIKWGDRILKEYTGWSLNQIMRIHRKAIERCSKGGKHDLETVSGFPGETLEHCSKCKKIIDTFFYEGAVI